MDRNRQQEGFERQRRQVVVEAVVRRTGRKSLALAFPERTAQLEEHHISIATIDIAGERRAEAGQLRRAHDTPLVAQRVAHGNRRTPAAKAGKQRGFERTDEREGDGFVESGTEARLANPVLDGGRRCRGGHFRAPAGERGGHPRVADHPADLLDEVLRQ